ncbi:ATP-binding cassette domain-containing protein [Nonomuraea sp. NPDC049309]|uniref:ATP-binding cassette domain-containing protein n=1 Tax=Nonomuraea sp. NPDC049309 TaxID=3364350 RepID=UPI003721C5E0
MYATLTVADHLRLSGRLNTRWDDAPARDRIARLGLDPGQRAGRLSGGQRARLALTLGLAERPELLLLDEPVATLDPLARREFLQDLMEAVAEHGPSVVLSSGHGKPRSEPTGLAEEPASRGTQGYMVAAIDHTCESVATAFPDGRVTTCVTC